MTSNHAIPPSHTPSSTSTRCAVPFQQVSMTPHDNTLHLVAALVKIASTLLSAPVPRCDARSCSANQYELDRRHHQDSGPCAHGSGPLPATSKQLDVRRTYARRHGLRPISLHEQDITSWSSARFPSRSRSLDNSTLCYRGWVLATVLPSLHLQGFLTDLLYIELQVLGHFLPALVLRRSTEMPKWGGRQGSDVRRQYLHMYQCTG